MSQVADLDDDDLPSDAPSTEEMDVRVVVLAPQDAGARLDKTLAEHAVGLSRAKTETLRRAADAVDRGELDLDAVCHMEAVAATRRLTAIKGIGRWTADVYLLFCGGHPDIFPSGDIALQNAVAHAFGLAMRPSPQELDRIAEGWSPWRGVSARLFWAYYSREMRREAAPVLEG